jgi:glycogen debranching enzyme
MYDETTGCFWPLVSPAPDGRPALTWAALSPLALPDLPQEIGRRLIEEHLLDPQRFWLPVPPASVSAAEPSFSVQDTGAFGLRRYWRGPTWINAAWLVWLGMVRLGYAAEGAELVRRVCAAIRAEGLREYYDPHTGRGMGAVDFGWSSLVMELVAEDERAKRSYLTAR